MTHTEVKVNQLYIMTIHLDPEWLADENTAYPIRIDPTMEINYANNGANAIQDVTINSTGGSSATSGSLYIGKRQDTGIARTLVKFPGLDISSFSSSNLISAHLMLRDLMCESEQMSIYCHIFGGNEWDQSTVNWSNVDPHNISYWTDIVDVSYSIGLQSSPVHWYGIEFSNAINHWVSGAQSQEKGILLKAEHDVEYGTGYQHVTFASYNRSSYKPYVVLTYFVVEDVPAPTGALWSFDENGASGWAWRSDIPDTAISVHAELRNSSNELVETYSALAHQYNSSLAGNGYGNGYHAFNIPIDWTEIVNDIYSINVYAIGYYGAESNNGGITYLLDGCPQTFNNIYYRPTNDDLSLSSIYDGTIPAGNADSVKYIAEETGMFVLESYGSHIIECIIYWKNSAQETIYTAYSTKKSDIDKNFQISLHLDQGDILIIHVRLNTTYESPGEEPINYQLKLRPQKAQLYTFNYSDGLDTRLDPNSPIRTTLTDAMDYMLDYNYNQPKDHILNTDSDTGRTRLNSDLVIFSGHGDVGGGAIVFTSETSNYDMLPMNELVDMSSTQLAIWSACESASPQNNSFASAAERMGAKTSIGWEESIFNQDSQKWLEYFLDALATGITIKESCEKADSDFLYNHGQGIADDYNEYSDFLHTLGKIFSWEIYGDENAVIYNNDPNSN